MSRSSLKSQNFGAHQTLGACVWTRTKRGRRIVRLARTYALDRAIRGGVIEELGITVHMPISLRISDRLSRAARQHQCGP